MGVRVVAAMLSALLVVSMSPATSFVSTGWIPRHHRHSGDTASLQRIVSRLSAGSDFVDVEFEPVDESTKKQQRKEAPQEDSPSITDNDDAPKSLLELSLELDPRWKEARIPFVEVHSNRVIDCHVAFCVDLDGCTYGIGVPCDPAAAVTLQQGEKTMYMNPTEHEELVELMASKLQEYLGPDVFLKNTPKILTITGDLEKYTGNWQEELFDDTVDTATLLNDEDEGLDFFYDFMKKELGEEEFEKTIREARESDGSSAVEQELLELFDIPGLGNQADDVEGIQDMLKDLLDEDQEAPFRNIGEDLDHEGVALKLVGFTFSDGESYSLVKLLKPFTIVGRYVEDDDQDLRFDLLTPEEERLIIPRLERVAKRDLEEAGLSLTEP